MNDISPSLRTLEPGYVSNLAHFWALKVRKKLLCILDLLTESGKYVSVLIMNAYFHRLILYRLLRVQETGTAQRMAMT